MRDSWDQRKYLVHLYVIEQHQKFLLFIIGQLLKRFHLIFPFCFGVLYLLPRIVVNIAADHLLAFDIGDVELFQERQLFDDGDHFVESKLCGADVQNFQELAVADLFSCLLSVDALD